MHSLSLETRVKIVPSRIVWKWELMEDEGLQVDGED